MPGRGASCPSSPSNGSPDPTNNDDDDKYLTAQPTDVLLGRGRKIYAHPGNVAFRLLCQRRRAEYEAARRKFGVKNAVAQGIIDEIRRGGGGDDTSISGEGEGGPPWTGGRFLRQAGPAELQAAAGETASQKRQRQRERERLGVVTVESTKWVLAENRAALEKCMQTFRDLRRAGRGGGGGASSAGAAASAGNWQRHHFDEVDADPEEGNCFGPKVPAAIGKAFDCNEGAASDAEEGPRDRNSSGKGAASQDVISVSQAPRDDNSFYASSPGQSSGSKGLEVTPRKRAAEQGVAIAHHECSRKRRAAIVTPDPSNDAASNQLIGGGVSSAIYDWMSRRTSDFRSFWMLTLSAGLMPKQGPMTERDGGIAAMADLDEEAIQLFRTTFADKLGGTEMTADQIRHEWLGMSPSEREETYAIVRGRRPVTQVPAHPHAFMMQTLLSRMRSEMQVVPSDKGGGAMREAQMNCSDFSREFGNERLELFLRREGMDARRAAYRLARYWESRTKLFGRDKCYLPFTLSGALQDDLTAMSTGVFRLMPRPDAHDRRIVLYKPGRDSRYDRDSMVRSIMYVIEAMIDDGESAEKGFIIIEDNSESSLWSWDKKFHAAFVALEEEIMPFEWCGIHVCNLPFIFMKLIKPIALAMGDRRTRHRLVFHGHDFIESLREYGITRDRLSTDVGGLIPMDDVAWCQWIQGRLAAGK